jgi:FAD/FMN-containing dehydrogenase
VVRAEFVITEGERLLPYRKIMIPADENEFAPSGVVAPASVEQVQGVLAVCYRYKVPVWPDFHRPRLRVRVSLLPRRAGR